MKKIYISGAITNNPNYKEQFAAAEKKLIAAGHQVFNPAHNTGDSYKELIDLGMQQLMASDAIYMLPGHEESTGATLELTYAKAVGIEIIYADKNAPQAKESVVSVTVTTKNAIEISVDEYVRLKDLETRFSILRKNMINAEYCSLHNQIILGIENEYAQRNKELNADLFPAKN